MNDRQRLPVYLDRMATAIAQARGFLQGLDFETFRSDLRSQMAVTMALILLGEAAARISTRFPDFVQAHPEIPWSAIKGMRNLIAHDYHQLELSVVWETVHSELPRLLVQIESARQTDAQGE